MLQCNYSVTDTWRGEGHEPMGFGAGLEWAEPRDRAFEAGRRGRTSLQSANIGIPSERFASQEFRGNGRLRMQDVIRVH